MRSGSKRPPLDTYSSNPCARSGSSPGLDRLISNWAFATARTHLYMAALTWRHDWVLDCADAAAMVSRWQGLRLVAADASVLMTAIRAIHCSRSPASADQCLFAIYLPAAELKLYASVHSAAASERAKRMKALGPQRPGDLLLLDWG